MVSMVQAAMYGRAFSWRNDTDVCALFLLFLMAVFAGPCRVIFSIYCVMLCEEIHMQYTFTVPEDGGHNLPSRNVVFTFLGYGDPG